MPVTLSQDFLKLFFFGNRRHRIYQDSVDLYNNMRYHADGIMPERLIEKRRPSESEETLKYRKEIYVPKTKNPIDKVISSLSKIRRSPDWNIQYDEGAKNARIIDEESLKTYCETNYPEHGSITNWVFSHLLKNQAVDANAVVMVIPTNIDAANNNEYYKPVATIFNSDQVLFYEDGQEFAILKSYEKSNLIDKETDTIQYQAGNVFYVVTTTEFQKWEQTKQASYAMTQQLVHNKGILPVFKIRGQFLKQKDSCTILQSRLAPMLPSLDEAAREYSDLQAAKVQHMYPLFWYYQSKACNHCTGGKISTADGVQNCTHCNGSGKVKFSPYAHIEIDPPKIGEQAVPAPGAGYVQRDVDIIKHQEESIDKQLYTALASINMQFLDQTPLNISGEAKQVDREELNNFVYSFAEDLVATMDKIYWWICEWRYSVIVPDAKTRQAMLPKISVPENFDLLPSDYLMDEISKAKTAKVNPILVATMEEDYASKKFYNNPELSSVVGLYYELDPLPGMTVDEKMTLLSNKGITQEDFVISSYIVSFVRRAMVEDKEFMGKPFGDKWAVMQKYAGEKIKANSPAEQVKQQLMQAQQQQDQFGQAN